MIKFLKNILKKNNVEDNNKIKLDFDIHSTTMALAYEVARSDGEIEKAELDYLKNLIDESECKESIINQLQEFSDSNTSFYNFIKDINRNCSKEEKEGIIRILWDVAYSDDYLEVHEERIIRRIADLIMIKDIKVLKIKDDSKNAYLNN